MLPMIRKSPPLIVVLLARSPLRGEDRLPVRTLPRDQLLLFPAAWGSRGRPGQRRTGKAAAGDPDGVSAGGRAVPRTGAGRVPLDVKTLAEETDCGTHVRRTIEYTSEPNGPGPGVPADSEEGSHRRGGQGSRRSSCLHPTDNVVGCKVVVGLGGKANRQYASELAERGVHVTLAPSYPLLANYQPDLKGLGWESGTMKAIWDASRGLDLLDSLPFVRTGRYGVIGHSLRAQLLVRRAVRRAAQGGGFFLWS